MASAPDRETRWNEPGEFDVFLCYNSADRATVQEVADRLRDLRLKPWLDHEQLRPGLPVARGLQEQIGKIKAAAVFVGASGVGPWQEIETYALLGELIERGCSVIPVLLPDCPEKPPLPPLLKINAWVDLRAAEPNPIAQLYWGITGNRLGEVIGDQSAGPISSERVQQAKLSDLRGRFVGFRGKLKVGLTLANAIPVILISRNVGLVFSVAYSIYAVYHLSNILAWYAVRRYDPPKLITRIIYAYHTYFVTPLAFVVTLLIVGQVLAEWRIVWRGAEYFICTPQLIYDASDISRPDVCNERLPETSLPSSSFCHNGRVYATVRSGKTENQNESAVTSDFYVLAHAEPSSDARICAVSRSAAYLLSPTAFVDHWADARSFCAIHGGELLSEARWNRLAERVIARTKSRINRDDEIEMDGVYFRLDEPEMLADCVAEGCSEHVGRSLIRDPSRNVVPSFRLTNPLNARFRCTLGPGVDSGGRIYRWLFAGPFFFGRETDLDEAGRPEYARPELGARVTGPATLGRSTVWQPYEAALVEGHSVSACNRSQVSCDGIRVGIDLECAIYKRPTVEASQSLAIVATYLVVEKDIKLLFSIGSDDVYKLWLDGKLLAEHLGKNRCISERSPELREDRPVTLLKGTHLIIASVGNRGQWWGLTVRLLNRVRVGRWELWFPAGVTRGVQAVLHEPDTGYPRHWLAR